jgi:hypothetical protein
MRWKFTELLWETKHHRIASKLLIYVEDLKQIASR